MTNIGNIYMRYPRKKIKLNPTDNVIDVANKNCTEGEFICAISGGNVIAKSGTLAGTKNWDITFESTYDRLMARMDEQDKRIDEQNKIIAGLQKTIAEQNQTIAGLQKTVAGLQKTVSYLAKKDIILVSSQALLFLINEQPKRFKPCTRFNNCENIIIFLNSLKDKAFIQDLIPDEKNKEDINEMQKIFGNIANNIINSRNKDIAHFSNDRELAKNIKEIMEVFKNNPNLVKECPNEYFVLSHYNLLKKAFAV